MTIFILTTVTKIIQASVFADSSLLPLRMNHLSMQDGHDDKDNSDLYSCIIYCNQIIVITMSIPHDPPNQSLYRPAEWGVSQNWVMSLGPRNNTVEYFSLAEGKFICVSIGCRETKRLVRPGRPEFTIIY